jgi:ABC-type transporter Mla maintaining outer membrane lipid asymmetry ATPase subunit MlaF
MRLRLSLHTVGVQRGRKWVLRDLTLDVRPGQRWALVAGSLLQAAVIATGVVVPVMYGLGAIFAALWATAIWLARRYQVP